MTGAGARSVAEAEADVPASSRPSNPRWVWAVGGVLALIVMGPALGPGALLNLDLVAVPDPPVPRGVWGLGPELPRRVPMFVPMAWVSVLVDGATITKLVMVGGVVVAFAGMYRLVARIVPTPAAWPAAGAAALYAFGPFLLTRLAVGHLNIVWTMALLPWALRDLLAPDEDLRRVFLWAAAIGFTGNYGGVLCGLVLVAGLVARRGRRAPAVLGLFLVAQLPWLVPLIVVGSGGTAIADAAAFPTSGAGFVGVGELLAGHGFWNVGFQIGWPGGWTVAVAGFILLLLAAVGTADLPATWRWPLVALAAGGFAAAAASGVPGLDTLVVRLSRTPFGAPMREAQRLLPLYLLWVAPAAALGAARLAASIPSWFSERARRSGLPFGLATAVTVLPLVVAVALALPARWGAGGQLRPVDYPADWVEARERVRAEPGPLVAFPWYQYFTFDVADNRLVLNTVPLYFGGDVIVSSDPGIGTSADGSGRPRERGDRREARVDLLVGNLHADRPISADLVDMGVRWVVLMKDVDWTRYQPALQADTGLERVVDGVELQLYRVRDWRGAVIDDRGQAVGARSVIAPLVDVDPSGPARAAIPGTEGWVRGLKSAHPGADGLLSLPTGGGWLWYWPAVPVVLADLLWLGFLVAAIRRREPRAIGHSTQSQSGTKPLP